jgi:hypothetical protein
MVILLTNNKSSQYIIMNKLSSKNDELIDK